MRAANSWFGPDGQCAPIAGSCDVFCEKGLHGPVAADPQGDSYVQQLACEKDRPFSCYLLNRAGRDCAAAHEQKPARPLRLSAKGQSDTFRAHPHTAALPSTTDEYAGGAVGFVGPAAVGCRFKFRSSDRPRAVTLPHRRRCSTGEIGRLWRLAITFRRPTMDLRSSSCRSAAMELTVVPIVKPDAANFIFGQSHFIKTVEDLHEALVGAVPGIRFGLAFCEASGKRLVRWSGNDEAALALARDNALAIGAGHTFLIFLGDGFFPVNVLAAVRAVPEVCRIYCATANPTQVIVAQTDLGRGVLGVVDGASPLGVETDADIAWRKDLLRKLGYKL